LTFARQEIISAAYRTIAVKEGPAGDLFLDLAKRYPDEDLIALDAFGRQIFVAKPRLLADLLSHKCYDFAKPKRIAAFLRLIIGDGLITVEEDSHKFLRKNTLPAFHARHITDLYPMIWTKAGILTRRLQSEIANGASTESKGSAVLELTAWASKVTLDIIGIAGMGREINAVEKASDPLQELYEELLEPSREKIIFAALNLAFGFHIIKMLPWQLNKLFVYLTSSLDNICRDLIREKRHAIVQTKDDHFDILSLLIKSNNFDDEVLKDQLLTFLAAGYVKTTAAVAIPSLTPISGTKPQHQHSPGQRTSSPSTPKSRRSSATRSPKPSGPTPKQATTRQRTSPACSSRCPT
jgi:cytochrome P450